MFGVRGIGRVGSCVVKKKAETPHLDLDGGKKGSEGVGLGGSERDGVVTGGESEGFVFGEEIDLV